VAATPAGDQPSLRLFALGPARVERAGQPLAPADWGYARPRELLFYLLTYPPQTKEQIGLVFWPDATPEQLRRNLGVALHHIRRALGGPEWIVLDRDRYTFNRALGYWFDVEAFETAVATAQQSPAGTPGEPGAHRRALETAVELYRGDFLADLADGAWYLPRREQLQSRFLESLLALGDYYLNMGEYSRALDTFRRAIEHEPYLEAAYRGLMRGYARLGEPGLALRQFTLLRERLRDDLDVAPAPETAALAEQLRRGTTA
jgi:DNA-binding SARP family transcriptional activator